MIVQRIVSGGQTGADRAALDFALEQRIPHGGWCPKGRLAEDGRIPDRYALQETPSGDYAERTEQNLVDSDGTVIFTISSNLTGGSKLTAEFAERHQKPWIHLCAEQSEDPKAELLRFVNMHRVSTLNVAGSRASTEPAVYDLVKSTLLALIKGADGPCG